MNYKDLIDEYEVDVDFPDASGIEHLEMLLTRNELAAIEQELTPAQRQRFKELLMTQRQVFETHIPAEQLLPLLKLPENFAGKMLEVRIRPIQKRIFRSLTLIHIDTKTFRFSREDANER